MIAGVTLYDNGDYGGLSERFIADDPVLTNNPIGNDYVSSVRVAAGCRAVLYRNASFSGKSTVLTHDVPSLKGSKVGNDEASSIQVSCSRQP